MTNYLLILFKNLRKKEKQKQKKGSSLQQFLAIPLKKMEFCYACLPKV